MAANFLRPTSRFQGVILESPVQLLPGYSNVSNLCRDAASNLYAVMTQNGDGVVMRRDALDGGWERVFTFDDRDFGKIAGCSVETIGPYLMVVVSEREVSGQQVQKVYLLGNCGVVAHLPWPPTGHGPQLAVE